MKHTIIFLIISSSFLGFSQKKVKINLNNALVIGQIDKPQERYAIEVALTNLLTENGVKAAPSLNYMRVGADSQVLASDSMITKLKGEGFDTYIIVNVRGYDRKYKETHRQDPLIEKLGQGSLHELYRQDIVSITFEFLFYRNGQYLTSELIKLGNISDRESVLKRFNKKVGARIAKRWK